MSAPEPGPERLTAAEVAELRDRLIAARRRLEKAYAEDARAWRSLWVLLERVRVALREGRAVDTMRAIQRGCDVEFGLLIDCEAFGCLSEVLDQEAFFDFRDGRDWRAWLEARKEGRAS